MSDSSVDVQAGNRGVQRICESLEQILQFVEGNNKIQADSAVYRIA